MPTYLQEAARYITSKLKGTPTFKYADIVEEQDRLTHHGKLYDYYMFNRDAIYNHVVSAMKGTFKAQTIAKMQFPFYNLTKKVIDRLAVAYLEPAERYVVVPTAKKTEGTETMALTDPRAERDNMLYQAILHGSNINAAAKQWNRLAKLHDTVYVEVSGWNGKIEYDVHPPQTLSVIESRMSYLEPSAVKYDKTFGGETHTIVWTPTEHKILNEDGEMPPDLNPWGGENKYGLIPLIPCRLKMTDDHWGEGDTELVYLNEKLNIAIASLFFNGLMQSHGQPVAINMNFPEEFSSGPDKVIEINDVQKDDIQPSFGFAHPNPAIGDNIKLIDWMIKQAAVMKGISAQSMNTEISDRQSGVAKGVDLAELREHRRDDIEFLRPFEKRLFDVTRRVWNTLNTEKISESAVFGIDFVEPQIPVAPMDDVIIKEKKMAMGMWSPVLEFIDEDEAIGEDQALAEALKMAEWNRRLRSVNEKTV